MTKVLVDSLLQGKGIMKIKYLSKTVGKLYFHYPLL